jgi:hypothetical protein
MARYRSLVEAQLSGRPPVHHALVSDEVGHGPLGAGGDRRFEGRPASTRHEMSGGRFDHVDAPVEGQRIGHAEV